MENELKKEYETLTSFTERYHLFIQVFKDYHCQLKDQTNHQLLNIKSPQFSSNNPMENDGFVIQILNERKKSSSSSN